MLSAIKEIGKWQKDKDKKDELDTLIQEPFKSGYVIFIKINLDRYEFDRIELEEYDSSKKMKYLFRAGPSNGPNPTPCAKITDVDKTFGNKIQKWFEKKINVAIEESNFLNSIRKILSENKNNIIKAIQTYIKDVDRKVSKLLSIKIKQNNEWNYIGDFEVFRKSLKEIETQKTAGISANNKDCSVCGERKPLVSGDSGIFKFYTIDKPGFITGGFNENLAWRNYPICPECKLELEEGRKFVEKNLTYGFYGLRYFLIPKLLLGSISANSEIINILLDSSKVVSLKDRVRKRITNDNNEILEILAEEKDILTLNFLFLSKEQSAERILLLIEDVFPSRIRKILKAKDDVDKVFNSDSDKSFTFGTIRTFFYKSSEGKKENDLNKYFLEIVNSAFKGNKLDFSFLVNFFMRKIQRDFLNYDSKGKEKYNFHLSIKEALMTTMFFESLGLITFKEVENMEESIFEEVFKKYGNTFASPVRRGLFLAGALTQMLLNKQAKERGAKPFMKRLKGLKMDEQDIKALLPAIQNKFEEYNSYGKGKRIVAEETYNYLFAAGDNWKLSVDEINFYFAGGMNLVGKIKEIIYTKVEKDVDLEEDVESNEIKINKKEE